MSLKHASGSGNVKQLRFITNQGAPHPKRRRVQAACLNCRRRKTACSGEQPSCITCQQNKLQCSGYAKWAGKEDKTDSSAEHGNGDGLTDRKPSIQLGRKTTNTLDAEVTQTGGLEDESPIDDKQSSPLFQTVRNRMPYFRWLGPTAIMPGFKQMVVKVNHHRPGAASSTDEGGPGSPSVNGSVLVPRRTSSNYSAVLPPPEMDARSPLALPFYDTSSMPPSELITHLCETFFTHLGCNFPFLQKDRFLKDLEAKEVDAILVDAVCAMAARFSTHPLLVEQADENGKSAPSEYGQAFAQRAKAALVDTYAVPTVSAVQSALLIAYNEFGESRDSGLWVYLGISIRMAQDLGLQKVEGLRFEGMDGPTPRMVKAAENGTTIPPRPRKPPGDPMLGDEQEVRAVERERVDTFWAVFFLDKAVSSGTGRRSTLRDNEIELSFPPLDNSTSTDGWPSPFPASIRIMHLYGRVTDLLNSIKEPSDITPGTSIKLAAMEAQVTEFYQSLSPRLHFDPTNFLHYVQSGDGTTFILVHFWFHTLIILLHQPTLLKTFEGRMLQLFPNSLQLSMSSAKTIADILSYSQLMKTTASLGNPFTTQPIYIAACAFLKETADRTASSTHPSQASSRVVSGANTPTKPHGNADQSSAPKALAERPAADSTAAKGNASGSVDKTMAKHSLLVKRATQEYQQCYKALQSLETYWAGTKYILTVVDQKVKGVGDPLLYTAEEGEHALEQPRPAPAYDSPGWRRKATRMPPPSRQDGIHRPNLANNFQFSEDKDPSQPIGWTMTGDLNSTNTNLSWHYPTNATQSTVTPLVDSRKKAPKLRQNNMQNTAMKNRSASSNALPPPSWTTQSYQQFPKIESPLPYPSGTAYVPNDTSPMPFGSSPSYLPQDQTGPTSTALFGDIMIESQDVDMSLLGFDMLSWLGPAQGDYGFMDDGSGGGGDATIGPP